MSHDAVLKLVDGYCVVEQTDEIIWVAGELWRQIVEDIGQPDLEYGGAAIDVHAGTLAFGTPGRGLGRLSYRFLQHRPDLGVYVYERIPE